MRTSDIGGLAGRIVAILCACVALPVFPAHAHGLTPELVLWFFGALAVHVGTPLVLAIPRAFRGRRGKVFGAYAVVMVAYYAVMWIYGIVEMFFFPVFPPVLAGLLYFLVGKVPEEE